MTATPYVTIWCDNETDGVPCVRFIETEYHTAKTARASARREGWIVSIQGGRDLCPKHDRIRTRTKREDE